MNRGTLVDGAAVGGIGRLPAAVSTGGSETSRELRGLWKLVSSRLSRPWLWTSVIALGLTLNLGAQTLSPILVGEILDSLVSMAGRSLSESLVLLALTVVAQIALTGGLGYLLAAKEASIGSRLREDVGMAILALGRNGRGIDVGDATTRVLSDSQRVQASFGGLFLNPVIDVLGLLLAAGVMIALHPVLGLLTLCIAPCSMLAIRKLSRDLQANAAAMQVSVGGMAGTVQSWTQRASWVSVFGISGAARERFHQRSSDVCAVATHGAALHARIAVLTVIVGVLPQLGILGVGGHQVMDAELTVGGLVALMGLSGLVAPPLNRLVTALGSSIPTVLPSYRRLQEVLAPVQLADIEPEPASGVTQLEVRRMDVGKVDGPGRLITVPDFVARRGEIVCIVGENGSGKSAFLTALLGLRPSTGEARVSGAGEARPLRVNDVAFAPSEPVVFEGTLLDNVLLFKPAANLSEELAHWGTSGKPATPIVPERGVTLSRGELQKLAVARALGMQRPLIILDEPTTGMDERAVEDLFRYLRAERERGPVIVVTHDAKLQRLADRSYQTLSRDNHWFLLEGAPASSNAPKAEPSMTPGAGS